MSFLVRSRPALAGVLFLIVGSGAALGVAASAQEAGTAGLPFVDRVEVDVVDVDVTVTDGEGRYVTGLTADDFELRVDGEPVEITNFYVGEELRRRMAGEATPDAGAPAPAGEPAAGDGAPAPEPEPAAPPRPLHLVAYVDHVQLTPGSRRRVLDELRDTVMERAAAGDRVMLVGYDGSLDIVQPFTDDAEELERGLEALSDKTTRRQIADSELRQTLVQIQRLIAQQQASLVQDEVASYRQRRIAEAMGSYDALDSLVRSLGGLPGRKALLYVSEGIPRSPGADLVTMVSGGNPLPGQREDLGQRYEEIARQANAREIALYALDARGATPDFFGSSATKSIALSGDTVNAEFTRETNLQEPLLDMAQATGGRAVINTNNVDDALDDLVTDLTSYYSLGFQSSFDDGEFHSIDVRLRDPERQAGLTLRHRAGFIDRSTEERVADRVRAFLLQGWESNPMGVELGFGEPKKRRGSWRVPVLIRVPADAVTLLPRGNELRGKLHVFLASRDDEGRVSEVTRLPQEVSLERSVVENREDGAGGLGYSFQMDLRPGPGALVVAVWDEVGGTESYLFQRVNVGG